MAIIGLILMILGFVVSLTVEVIPPLGFCVLLIGNLIFSFSGNYIGGRQ